MASSIPLPQPSPTALTGNRSIVALARRNLTLTAALAGSAGLALVVLDSAMGMVARAVVLAVIVLLAAGLVETVRGRLVRASAGLEVALGIAGGSIAAGYAVSHSLEPSLSAAIVGLATTTLWLLVLASGLIRLLRISSWTMRIAAVPVALLVTQFGIMPIVAGTAGAHPPRIPIEAPVPAGARDVSFAVAAGVELGGWYTPSTNGAAVVLLPGAGGNRTGTTDHAAVLARHGYGVLAVDARGSGDSGGIGNLWGWYGLEDITGAINWLAEQPDVDAQRIGLVGMSMGGEQSVTVAPADHRVRAVVAEGVQGRVAADMWYVGDDLRSLIERTVSAEMWAVADLWTEVAQPAPLREVGDALDPSPVLIVAADAPDERAVSADLASRAASVEVWQTTGIGHTLALTLAPAEWEARVIGFLDRNL